MKYVNPIIGLIVILLSQSRLFIFNENISIWDFEGFSFASTCLLLAGILLFVNGLYGLLKNDTIEFRENALIILSSNNLIVPYNEVKLVKVSRFLSTIQSSKGNFHIQNMFVNDKSAIDKMMIEELKFKKNIKSSIPRFLFLGFIALLVLPMVFFHSWHPNHLLPLKKIETIEIEGTVISTAIVSLMSNDKYTLPSLSFGGSGVEEFPYINFRYDGLSKLDDNIINFQNSNPQKVEELNASGKYNWTFEKQLQFPKGTKVKMKIRPEDYKDLKKYMKSEEYLTNIGIVGLSKNSVKVYEFAVNDEIILQKVGLK